MEVMQMEVVQGVCSLCKQPVGVGAHAGAMEVMQVHSCRNMARTLTDAVAKVGCIMFLS